MNINSIIFLISILVITSCSSHEKKEETSKEVAKKEPLKSKKQTQKSHFELTGENIVALLFKKKSEIIALLGQYEEGTFAIAECHQMIPALIFDNGLTIYFTNLEDDEKPLSIELNDKITFKGIKSGLNFGEVQDILGKGEDISSTWIASEDDKAYKLMYYYGNFSVSVISYNVNGNASSIVLEASDLNIFTEPERNILDDDTIVSF